MFIICEGSLTVLLARGRCKLLVDGIVPTSSRRHLRGAGGHSATWLARSPSRRVARGLKPLRRACTRCEDTYKGEYMHLILHITHFRRVTLLFIDYLISRGLSRRLGPARGLEGSGPGSRLGQAVSRPSRAVARACGPSRAGTPLTDTFLAGVHEAIQDVSEDGDLFAKFEAYILGEETRMKQRLETVLYNIDAPNTLSIVTGFGRLEKVRLLYILVDLAHL